LPSLQTISLEFRDNIDELKNINIINENIEENKLLSIYYLLNRVNGMGPTAISKYLHMHKPDLFIMWDKQIFIDYFNINTVLKSTATLKGISSFLKAMKAEVMEAIKNYSNIKGIKGFQVKDFQIEFNNETLLRIIDKYNYMIEEKYL